MNYKVLSAAQADIQAIDDWVTGQFGKAVAAKASERLYHTFALLAVFPGMGLRRPEVASDPVRFFFLRPNWIIYTPGEPLVIRRVFPSRTDIRNFSL